MTPIGVAELKARLSEYLRAVRRGQELTITDRDAVKCALVGTKLPVATATGSFGMEPERRVAYGSSRTQMLRKLIGSLLSPCA